MSYQDAQMNRPWRVRRSAGYPDEAARATNSRSSSRGNSQRCTPLLRCAAARFNGSSSPRLYVCASNFPWVVLGELAVEGPVIRRVSLRSGHRPHLSGSGYAFSGRCTPLLRCADLRKINPRLRDSYVRHDP